VCLYISHCQACQMEWQKWRDFCQNCCFHTFMLSCLAILRNKESVVFWVVSSVEEILYIHWAWPKGKKLFWASNTDAFYIFIHDGWITTLASMRRINHLGFYYLRRVHAPIYTPSTDSTKLLYPLGESLGTFAFSHEHLW